MMLGTAATILLILLPSQVNALITTDAKCLAGYDWMFSSIGQSPCDVAAELATVCLSTQTVSPYNLPSLPVGYGYTPPTLKNQNDCICSSVFYSLQSGCAYCQDRLSVRWNIYVTNCSMVYLTVFNRELPVGVKVPTWAYQNVSISNGFNATLASRMKGIESSRPVPSNTQIPTSTSALSSPAATSSSGGGNTTAISTPAIVVGAVGGLVGLGLIAALITFLVLRSKQRSQSQNRNSDSPQSPNMVYTPDTTALIHSAPSDSYNPDESSTYSFPDPDMYGPHRQHSPPVDQDAMPTQNVGPNSAGTNVQNSNNVIECQ